uniref:Exostosin domain-containing protein n=1 Tax=Angiostrongylus cantonensis TaxID=6313 RepID=A0A158P869_ANGCA
MVTRVIVLLILPRLASTFYAYTPETFPDSIEQPIACNMHQASFLCDPSNQKILLINENFYSFPILSLFRPSTRCTCSPMDVGQCDDSPRGFTISVAVVRKMVNLDSIRMAAEEFADALRERQNRGQCNDDVLIFVSVDDHVVKYFSTLIIPVDIVILTTASAQLCSLPLPDQHRWWVLADGTVG